MLDARDQLNLSFHGDGNVMRVYCHDTVLPHLSGHLWYSSYTEVSGYVNNYIHN